jgi:hypothetical protein
MPNWAQPCPVEAKVAPQLGAGGATSFVFDRGEVFRWQMTIQGSRERILDSVLPHEVTHTVFATHFRQPLPRWADEGACTTVEHESERAKQQNMLINFLRTGRGIAFSQMFVMKEYPRDVLPLYSQGYSVARYLIAQGGKRKFLDFLADGLRDENWSRAMNQHYSVGSLAALQNQWLDWVRQGSPPLDGGGDQPALVAVNAPRSPGRRAKSRTDETRLADARGAVRPGPTADEPGPSIYERAAASPEALEVAPVESDQKWHPPGSTKFMTSDATADRAVAVYASPDQLPGPEHQVTRPQPMERPRQVILEWSRPPGVAASTGPPVAQTGSRMPSAN